MIFNLYFQKHIYRAKINHFVRHTNILGLFFFVYLVHLRLLFLFFFNINLFNWKLTTSQYCTGSAIHQHESTRGTPVYSHHFVRHTNILGLLSKDQGN